MGQSQKIWLLIGLYKDITNNNSYGALTNAFFPDSFTCLISVTQTSADVCGLTLMP